MRNIRRVFHKMIDADSILLSEDESHHVSRVLRLKTGDRVEVFDGQGGVREARIGEIRKREIEAVFAGPKLMKKSPSPDITLAVVPPKGQRMDTLVQMAQEIGLNELIPIITDNSVMQEFSENRVARWQRVAIAASKQSYSDFIVKFGEPKDFDVVLQNLKIWDLCILCHTDSKFPSLGKFLPNQSKPESVLICIGPEGGFSKSEIELSIGAKCNVVRLAAPVMRVETAAIFALSTISSFYCRVVDK